METVLIKMERQTMSAHSSQKSTDNPDNPQLFTARRKAIDIGD